MYDRNNVFAKILRGEIPANKVYEDEHTLAFMDVMPQSDGHVLVIPKADASNLFDISPPVLAALMTTTQKVARVVQQAFQADGIALMQFNGAVAGQTVFHLHFHVIPRYANRPLRSHSREMADAGMLGEHAERIRTAFGTSE